MFDAAASLLKNSWELYCKLDVILQTSLQSFMIMKEEGTKGLSRTIKMLL